MLLREVLLALTPSNLSPSSWMPSVSSHAPMPRARSTKRASPRRSCVMVEDCRLALAERTHHFDALDRRVGRVHRLETAHRPNPPLVSLPWSASTILFRYLTCRCCVSCGHLPSAFSSARAAA
jgi:hypothetical protein